MREVRYVQRLQPVAVHHKRIPELNCNPARIIQIRCADGRGNFRGEGIIEVDDDERFVCENVGKCSSDSDSASASKHAAGIERKSALQEIVGGIASRSAPTPGLFDFRLGSQ